MIETMLGLFMFFGVFGTLLGIGAWVADHHGDWIDRLPLGFPVGDDD